MNIKTEELLDLSSDYTLTIYTIDQKVTKDEKPKLTNAITYAEYINKNLNYSIPLEHALDIEKEAEMLTSTLEVAAFYSTRRKLPSVRKSRHTRTNQNQEKSKETMAKHNMTPIQDHDKQTYKQN